jgi:hypothetical protein
MVKLMNAPQRARGYVCALYFQDRIKGPLWKVYETEEYDPETDTAHIHGKAFQIGVVVKDIRTDSDLVATINDLKHFLKAGQPYSALRAEFSDLLNNFIADHGLDSDPHAFATKKED